MPLMQGEPGQKLCASFNLGGWGSVEPMGGTRNRNFLLMTDRGKWFVRQRYPGYCDKGRIQFDHQAARFLAERGVPVLAPRIANNGNSFQEHGDWIWEVYSFVEGRHLRDGDRKDIAALGRSLAVFHQVGCDFHLRYKKAAPRGETDPARLLERLEKIERETPPVAEASCPYRQALFRAAEELPPATYSALPHTLIHGDVQPANILVNNDEIRAFVDLDWCGWQTRIYDLGFAILCCCAIHETPFDGGNIWSVTQPPRLDPEMIREFLIAYENAGTTLSSEEAIALVPQLILTWCEMRIDGAFKVSQEKRFSFLSREPVDFEERIRQTLHDALNNR